MARTLYRGCTLQTSKKKKSYENFRNQAMGYIGAQFGECRALESRDKPLKMLKSCKQIIKVNTQEDRKIKESRLFVEFKYNSHNKQFSLAMRNIVQIRSNSGD